MRRRPSLWILAALLSLLLGVIATRAPAGGNPLSRAAPAQFTFEGEVTEQLSAGSYLYLQVDGHWAVTLAATAPQQASSVRLTVFARSDNFHSERLHRDFDELWFAAVQPVAPARSTR